MTTLDTVQAALATSLLHSLWQILLLALLAASVLALLQRCSAALRHGVEMAFLVLMAAAPVATLVWVMGQPIFSPTSAASRMMAVVNSRTRSSARMRSVVARVRADTGLVVMLPQSLYQASR